MADQKVQLMGVIEGSIPLVTSGGTPTTTDRYRVEVTKAGLSGVAEVTITSEAGDDLAASTIASGVAEALGTKGGTFTATFVYLQLGDTWTVQQYSTGLIDPPVAMVGNARGSIVPIRVNTEGELVASVELEAADIEIGAVELKNGATDDRALISAANTARAVGNMTLLVQAVDAAGAVLSTSALATSAKQPALGIAAAAASIPVVLASDHGALPLPTGAATQTTLAAVLADTADIDSYTSRLLSSANAMTPGATLATTSFAVGGQYNATPPTITDTHSGAVQLDVNGNLKVNVSGGTHALENGGVLDDIAGYLVPMTAPNVFTQLTAPGSTAAYAVAGKYSKHTFAITVANINSDVVFKAEGSIATSPGSGDWFNLGTDVTTVAGNGTTFLSYDHTPLLHVRFTWTAEHGGTAATIDVSYLGGK